MISYCHFEFGLYLFRFRSFSSPPHANYGTLWLIKKLQSQPKLSHRKVSWPFTKQNVTDKTSTSGIMNFCSFERARGRMTRHGSALKTAKSTSFPSATILPTFQLPTSITQNLKPKSKFRNDHLSLTTFFYQHARNRHSNRPFVASVLGERSDTFQKSYKCLFAL